MRAPSALGVLWDGLLSTLFPPRCPVCRAFLDEWEGALCRVCLDTLLLIERPFCERCGLPFDSGEPPICECRRTPPPFCRARAWALYGGALEEAILQLKFRGQSWLARPLASGMLASLPPGIDPGELDLVVPVPLHPRRLRERGYNQSVLLGRVLARGLGLPLSLSALRRVRPTQPQIGLSAAERRVNLDGAFVASPHRLGGRRVLLVDDVITTGSTLAGCAQALLEAGSGPVVGLALARAPSPVAS